MMRESLYTRCRESCQAFFSEHLVYPVRSDKLNKSKINISRSRLLLHDNLSRAQDFAVHLVSVTENFCDGAGFSGKVVRLLRRFVSRMVHDVADFSEPFRSMARKDVEKL